MKYDTIDGLLWSPSYFASLVSDASLEMLKSYIQEQKKPFLSLILALPKRRGFQPNFLVKSYRAYPPTIAS
ncbi:MAG: transposase [Cyanobacteriota bacterium]